MIFINIALGVSLVLGLFASVRLSPAAKRTLKEVHNEESSVINFLARADKLFIEIPLRAFQRRSAVAKSFIVVCLSLIALFLVFQVLAGISIFSIIWVLASTILGVIGETIKNAL